MGVVPFKISSKSLQTSTNLFSAFYLINKDQTGSHKNAGICLQSDKKKYVIICK